MACHENPVLVTRGFPAFPSTSAIVSHPWAARTCKTLLKGLTMTAEKRPGMSRRSLLAVAPIGVAGVALTALNIPQASAEEMSVTEIQKDLAYLAHLNFSDVDGVFGPRTSYGVRDFQDRMGLEKDGVAGPQTQGELMRCVGIIQSKLGVNDDGYVGQETIDATHEYQKKHRILQSGRADRLTLLEMKIHLGRY